MSSSSSSSSSSFLVTVHTFILVHFVLLIIFLFPALNNSRLLVTVTADFVDVNRLRTSYNGIHRILEQTAFNNSESELKRLDRIAYELANRNACFWLHQKLAKQYNTQTLEAVNRRMNDSLQENVMSKMNLKCKPLNMERFSEFSGVPRNFKYNTKGMIR